VDLEKVLQLSGVVKGTALGTSPAPSDFSRPTSKVTSRDMSPVALPNGVRRQISFEHDRTRSRDSNTELSGNELDRLVEEEATKVPLRGVSSLRDGSSAEARRLRAQRSQSYDATANSASSGASSRDGSESRRRGGAGAWGGSDGSRGQQHSGRQRANGEPTAPVTPPPAPRPPLPGAGARMGVAWDAAFCFYYHECAPIPRSLLSLSCVPTACGRLSGYKTQASALVKCCQVEPIAQWFARPPYTCARVSWGLGGVHRISSRAISSAQPLRGRLVIAVQLLTAPTSLNFL
jgi:hypothetical protein